MFSSTSNSTLPITLWGEIADAFNAEEVYTAGQTKPQIIVFVGTLVKNYKGIGIHVHIYSNILQFTFAYIYYIPIAAIVCRPDTEWELTMQMVP